MLPLSTRMLMVAAALLSSLRATVRMAMAALISSQAAMVMQRQWLYYPLSTEMLMMAAAYSPLSRAKMGIAVMAAALLSSLRATVWQWLLYYPLAVVALLSSQVAIVTQRSSSSGSGSTILSRRLLYSSLSRATVGMAALVSSQVAIGNGDGSGSTILSPQEC